MLHDLLKTFKFLLLTLSWIYYDRGYTHIRSFMFSSEKQNKKKQTRKYNKLNIFIYDTQHLKSIHFAKAIPFVMGYISIFVSTCFQM